jgi:WD40 repeat protein
VVAWNIDARTPSTAFSLPTSTVDSLVVAGDGRRLAYGASGDTIVLTLVDGKSRILPGASTPLAFSPNGQWLLAASGAQLFVWDLAAATPMPRTVLAHREQVLGAAWAPDGASFATVGTDGSAVIWSLDALSPLRSINVGTAPMTGVSFTPDARTLITVGAGGAVLAFDLSGSQGLAARLAEARSDSALVALACGLAGRGLTVEEWKSLLPDRSFQHICP